MASAPADFETDRLAELRRNNYRAASRYHLAVEEWATSLRAAPSGKVSSDILELYRIAALNYEATLVFLAEHIDDNFKVQLKKEAERVDRFLKLLRKEMVVVLGQSATSDGLANSNFAD